MIQDYALSDQYVDFESALVQRKLKKGCAVAAGFQGLAELSAAQWAPLLRSDPEYLMAAFDAIEARHGSVDDYLRDELGVDEPLIASIRDNLLETREKA